MSNEREIPNSDHIARYCKPRTLTEGDFFPTGASFCLRPDELSLSVNWLEFLDADNRSAAVEKLREIFRKKFNKVNANAKFAVLHVGEIITHVINKHGCLLKVIHEPEGNDPSHSGIHNIPAEEALLIGELIAEKYCDLYNARN